MKWDFQVLAWPAGTPRPVTQEETLSHIGYAVLTGTTGPGVHPEVSGVLADLATALEFGGRLPAEAVRVPPSARARRLLAAILAADPDDDEPEEPTDVEGGGSDAAPVAGVVIDVAAWESRRFLPRED